MNKGRKLTQPELAKHLGLLESEVALFVAENNPMPNGAGYWVHFDLKTPKNVLTRLEVGDNYLLALPVPVEPEA
ncbi:hypothetical protein HUS85_27535 [Pseudomonas protegens]|uniref:hypothetical protein n=1 Tax=Pseudomonas protegens TaxID=380021 RepID=UPI001B3174EF|nr:hypothetical protein [Pseudomonas protegens]MBP5119592.1 hypothetical protein [Pseudomonas protegens]QTU20656.1 hypothetical protein HUT22_21815 [Pseudomonas protegens]